MFFFRMPLYFILSGLFFKTYEGMFPFIKKKTNKLIIPFIFSFIFITIPSVFLIDKGNEMFINISLFEEKGRLNLGIVSSSWFLVCLFIVNLYFYSLFKLSRFNVKTISLFCIILGNVGYLLNVMNLYLPLWLDTSLTVMPFFLFGYLARNYSNILYEDFAKKHIILFLLALTALLLTYYIFEQKKTMSIYFLQNHYNVNTISLYLGGISGSCCVLLISKYLQKLPLLSYIGRYSIVVLLTHQPLLYILRNIFYQLGLSQDGHFANFVIFVMVLLLSVPIIHFCVRFLPYCFAQKDIWK